MGTPNDYIDRHETAMRQVTCHATKQETAIVAMLKGLNLYEQAYRRQYGEGIATDYVLGPLWETIAHALRGLLNGEIGRLDGGLTDKAICEALESAGFNPDVEGEKL